MADPYEKARKAIASLSDDIVLEAPDEIIASECTMTMMDFDHVVPRRIKLRSFRRFGNLMGLHSITVSYAREMNLAKRWLTMLQVRETATSPLENRAIVACKYQREAREIAQWRWRELHKASEGKPCKLQIRRHT